MKGGAEHRVPLSESAAAVLQQARMLDDGSGLVFPSPVKVGRAAVEYDHDKATPGHRPERSGDGSRVPIELPGLGGRKDGRGIMP